MNRLLEYIAGTFTAPRSTFAQIAKEGSMGAAVNIFILTALISSAAGLSGLPAREIQIEPLRLFPLAIVATFIFGALGWLLQTGIYHLFAEFLGGHGRALALFLILPFTTLPGIILTPINLVLSSLGVPLIGIFTSLALLAWIIFLQLIALSAVYNISQLRAAAVVFLPPVILITAFIIFGLTLLTTLMPLIMETIPIYLPDILPK
ncbi:MAG: Yip1 family protein [bacterium]|jgi:hypothetical protein